MKKFRQAPSVDEQEQKKLERKLLDEKVGLYRRSMTTALDKEKKKELRTLIENVSVSGSSPQTTQTEAHLIRKVWWWRYIPGARDVEHPWMLTEDGKVLMEEFSVARDELDWIALRMLRCQQHPAFIYEVAARMLAPKLVPIPWIKLTNDIKLPLIDAFERDNLYLGGVGILTPEAGPISSFWTQEPCDYSFNLLQSDSAIAELFLEWFIRPARQRQGVPSCEPNTGIARRPFSWRPIEYIDLHRFGIVTNDAGASKQRSRARMEVAEALEIPTKKGGRKSALTKALSSISGEGLQIP